MILTVLRLRSPPQRRAELVQALRSLMRSARAEKGLVNCRICLESDDLNVISYEERWETQEDLEHQVRSPRFTGLLTLMEAASEPPALEFHFVAETRGLEFVAAVRGGQANC